jgi:hypothetical protein
VHSQEAQYVSTRTIGILTEVPHGFPQYLQANVRTIQLLGYEHFPIPATIQHYYRNNLVTDSAVKQPTKNKLETTEIKNKSTLTQVI